MNSSVIKQLVEDELACGESFTNWHGITRDKIHSFLVQPFAVHIDPDDSGAQPRDMWIVLQERSTPKEGYVVVYDSSSRQWGVAEHFRDGDYTLVISATSLAGALEGM